MSKVSKERESLEKAQAQAVGYVQRLGKKVASAEKREEARKTRRKIVCGAAILTMVRKDAALRARFATFLNTFVTRAVDRTALELDEAETFLERDAREAVEQEREEAERKEEERRAAQSAPAAPGSYVDNATAKRLQQEQQRLLDAVQGRPGAGAELASMDAAAKSAKPATNGSAVSKPNGVALTGG